MFRWFSIFILCVLSLNYASGQVSGPDILLTCNYNHTPVLDILKDLEDHYNLNFSYSESRINLNFTFTCSQESISLDEFLKQLFTEHHIDYRYIHNQIVLTLAEAEKYYTIQGYVSDSATAESLIGVTIINQGTATGAVTNTYGFYSLQLPQGKQVLRFSYLGYKTLTDTVFIADNFQLNISLTPLKVSLEPIAIEYTKENQLVLSPLSGIDKVDIKSLRELPQLFGETDVLRNLSFLPGVLSKELSSGNLYIRGGNTDHSLFTMDGAPLSEVSHFGGFYSVFNSDIIKQISLHKGSMPASEKGALAAMVDVALREGNKKKWITTGGFSSMSARICTEGPVIKDKTSIIISARGSYIDRLLNLVNGDPFNSNLFNFTDLNVKIHHRFNQGGSLNIMGYAGDDRIIDSEKLKRTSRIANIQFTRSIGSKVFYENNLSFSKTIFSQEIDQLPYAFKLESGTSIMQWKNKFSYYVNPRLKFVSGYDATWQHNQPFAIHKLNDSSIYVNRNLYSDRSLEQAAFLEGDFSVGTSWQFNLGLRMNHYMLLGPQESFLYSNSINNTIADTIYYARNEIIYQQLVPEPRVSARFLINKQSSLKIAYNLVSQFYHQSVISHIGVRIYRIIPANKHILPQEANNFSFGYFYESTNSKIKASAEVFYRQMNNLTQSHLYSDLIETPQPEKYINTYPGNARGAELLFLYRGHKLTAQLNYTLSRTVLAVPEINHGKPFPTNYDVQHTLSVFANYKFNKRWQLSANWLFQSGLPYTQAVGKYQIENLQLIQFNHNTINTGRLPAYHRLDASVSFRPRSKFRNKLQGEWTFSIYNLYFHKNPLGTVYYNSNNNGNQASEDWNPYYVYFYQFVPAIAYNFRF